MVDEDLDSEIIDIVQSGGKAGIVYRGLCVTMTQLESQVYKIAAMMNQAAILAGRKHKRRSWMWRK